MSATPSRAYAWYVVVIIGLANTVSSIDRSFISLVAEPIRIDLKMSDTQVSLLMGLAYFLVYSIAVIPVAALADRRSRRNIIAIGIMIWTTATALCGLSMTYVRLFLMRMGVGLGESMLGPSAVSVITDYFPRHLLARAMSIYTVLGTVGTSLASVIGGLLYRYLVERGDLVLPLLGSLRPWQTAFLAISIPGFIVLLLIVTTIREPERAGGAVAARAPAPKPREVRAHLWNNRRAILVLVGGCSLLAASSGVALWNTILFIRVYGWEIGKIGPALGTVQMICTVLGVLSGGWCADFLRRKGYEDANLRIILTIVALITPSYLMVPNAGDPYVSLALIGIDVFGTNMCFGCITPALPLVAPPRMRSQIVALYFFTTNLLSTGVTTGVALITDYVFADPGAVRYSMTITYFILLPGAWLLLWFARPAYLAEVRRLNEAAA